jgi:phage tail sheath gpL-like
MSNESKIQIIKDLLVLKEKIKSMRYREVLRGKKDKSLYDVEYVRMLRIMQRIVDNQIDQVNV